jgi:hypothetical protein
VPCPSTPPPVPRLLAVLGLGPLWPGVRPSFAERGICPAPGRSRTRVLFAPFTTRYAPSTSPNAHQPTPQAHVVLHLFRLSSVIILPSTPHLSNFKSRFLRHCCALRPVLTTTEPASSRDRQKTFSTRPTFWPHVNASDEHGRMGFC